MRPTWYQRAVLAGAMCLLPSFVVAQQLPFGLPAGIRTEATAESARPNASAGSATTLYTFAVHGAAVSSPAGSRLSAEAGTVVLDTNGNVVGGEIDVVSPVITATQVGITGGAVTLNADGTGTLKLVLGARTQSFALAAVSSNGTLTSAALLEDDGLAGQAGTLAIQPVLSQAPQGSFSLSLSGETFEQVGIPDGVGVGGNLTLNGREATGKVSIFVGDAGHRTYTNTPFLAYTARTTATDIFGRSTLIISMGGTTVRFAVYAANATTLNLVSLDTVTATTPVIFGTAVQ